MEILLVILAYIALLMLGGVMLMVILAMGATIDAFLGKFWPALAVAPIAYVYIRGYNDSTLLAVVYAVMAVFYTALSAQFIGDVVKRRRVDRQALEGALIVLAIFAVMVFVIPAMASIHESLIQSTLRGIESIIPRP